METSIISWSSTDGYVQGDLQYAVGVLRRGGLVAFPTETVYGLGCDGLRPGAAKKVYEAKARPGDNPLILHISEKKDLMRVADDIPDAAMKLADAFWPGPMTLVLKKRDIVPDEVTGGLSTVAVRMPAHPAAAELISTLGVPIAAPSANLSGKPSPTSAEHVRDDLLGRIDVIIDGGQVGIGYESTIIDLTTENPVILRPGFITREMIEDVLGYSIDGDKKDTSDPDAVPKAPGMKYRHYAPEADMSIVRGDESAVTERIKELALAYPPDRVGILTTDERVGEYTHGVVASVGSTTDGTIGRELYGALRRLDSAHVEMIYSESFTLFEQSDAIMNRLIKAAGGRIIDLENYDKVIFVCKENITVSPMAEWIFKSILMDTSKEIVSRGLVVLFPELINARVLDVLSGHGIPCEEKEAKEFDKSEADDHTLIITMTFVEKVKIVENYGIEDHVYTLCEFVGDDADVSDPYGDETAYESLYEELKDLLYRMKRRLGWI